MISEADKKILEQVKKGLKPLSTFFYFGKLGQAKIIETVILVYGNKLK